MKKKSIILMAMIIVVALVACGGNEVSNNESNVENNITVSESGVVVSKQEKVDVSKISTGELTEDIVRNYPVTSEKDFEYEIDGEGIKIKKYIGNDAIVVIPDTIEEKNVTAISMLVFGNDSEVRGVYFPETVNVLKSTFTNNKYIEVVICEGIENVDFNAFNNCPSLHTFVVSNKLMQIGKFAFSGCTMLKELVIQAREVTVDENDPFLGCTNLTIIGESGSTIEAYAKEHGINFQAE